MWAFLKGFFGGFSTTLFTTVVMCGIFALSIKFQPLVQLLAQPWANAIEHVQYVLFFITFVLAAQFNRSRFSLISAFWLLFLFTHEYTLPWSDWVIGHNNWLVLTAGIFFVWLSVIKDRALLSIHGLKRIVLMMFAGGFAFAWLFGVDQLIHLVTTTPQYQFSGYQKLSLLSIIVPMGSIGCFLLWRSLRNANLFLASLFVSYIVWCVDYYQVVNVNWPVAMTLLGGLYLIAIIIDAYFLAYRDDLTGLPSRRALNQYVLSLGGKYTVAMLDIDHFKKFNDTYGHDIGDQVLKLVASKLAKVKIGGRVFRYGGEEFTIVFSRKNLEQSLPELERLRQSIADYNIVIRQPQRQTKQARKTHARESHKSVNVTISIGVAMRNDKQDFEQTLKISDQALYRAKKSGRNKVSE